MNEDVLRSLLAGWLSGAAAGLAITALVLVWASRRPALASRLPLQARLPVLGIVLANALVLGLTLVGLLLGAAYDGMGDGQGGGFALTLAGVLLAAGALYAFVRGGVRAAEAPLVLGALLLAGLAFGAMLPWLAGIEG